MNIVLVVDMIRGFLDKGSVLYCGDDSRRIIPNIVNLLKEDQSLRIYLVDTHTKDDLEFKMFPPHCIRGSVECELIPELKPFPGLQVNKTRYSGFYNTHLDEILKTMKPSKVTVVGVCTDICVLHTVADLRNRDYEVVVPRNCVASFNPEAHKFALEHIEKVLGANIVY